MKPEPWKGHVQVAFELKHKRTINDWLLEHGPTMTRKAAAEEIGYASYTALSQFVSRHMPKDFTFYSRPKVFSEDEIKAAIARRADNETWASIALSYGRDVLLLKDGCRRYLKNQKTTQEA